MTTQATREPDLLDCGPLVRQGQVLFVLDTDRQSAHDGFSLPFLDGHVVGTSAEELSAINRSFDAIIVDESNLASAVANGALRLLGTGGHVLVTLPDGAGPHALPTVEALHGLSWHGLGAVGGRPCVVLTVPPPNATAAVQSAPELTPSLFGLMHVAFDLGDNHRAEENERAARQWDVIADLNRQLHDSRQSEYALLLQLEIVVNQLEELRRQTQGIASVVAMLRLRRSGRLILWVLRASLRAARKLRRSAVGRTVSRVQRKL